MLHYYLIVNSILVKCEMQPSGSNLCGYFVCEWIRREVSERNPATWVQVREQIYSQFYFYYYQLC